MREMMRAMMSVLLEGALDEELDEELGYSKYDYRNKDTDNSRNGHYLNKRLVHKGFNRLHVIWSVDHYIIPLLCILVQPKKKTYAISFLV